MSDVLVTLTFLNYWHPDSEKCTNFSRNPSDFLQLLLQTLQLSCTL